MAGQRPINLQELDPVARRAALGVTDWLQSPALYQSVTIKADGVLGMRFYPFAAGRFGHAYTDASVVDLIQVGPFYVLVDCTHFAQFRWAAHVNIGSGTCEGRLFYTTDLTTATGWTTLDTDSDLDFSAAGYVASEWFDIPPLGKDLIVVAFGGLGGTDLWTSAPFIGNVSVLFRPASSDIE